MKVVKHVQWPPIKPGEELSEHCEAIMKSIDEHEKLVDQELTRRKIPELLARMHGKPAPVEKRKFWRPWRTFNVR